MTGRFTDGLSYGFEWIADEPSFMQRASHALVDNGRVWLVDPVDVDGLDERVGTAGEPAAVLQLLDRHGRDSDALARRYGVPLHQVPVAGAPGGPFEVVRAVHLPLWREAALWWPERHALVVADALGTASYFLAPGELLGVHPLLRLFPPRALASFEPEHVLCGHGSGIHGPEAKSALRETLRSSRRRTPSWLVAVIRSRGKRRSRAR